MLVPILYNVSGMIHGDAQKYDYDEWKELAYGHADEAYIDYEDFIGMLNDAMMTSDAEAMEIPFLSGADYEDKINLFLSASGMRWDSYEEQEKLFSMLYEYLSICQETKTDTPQLYMDYIKEKQATTFLSEGSSNAPAYLPLEIADDLQIDREDASMEVNDVSELFLSELIVSMFDRTDYFVENTGAEDIAFHSVFGLLSYRNYYVNRYFSANASVTNLEVHTLGNMEYWPIGIYGSKYEYAAQPLCYAAVVEGGDTRLAAKVLQSMMNQETDIKFGISVSKAAMEKQLESWLTTHDYIGNVRVLEPLKFEEGVQKYKIIHKKNYWGTYLSNRPSTYFEDKEIYTEQIDKQIKNITIAQIPDRELLTIWEESLMEAVGSNLSKEEGFALLCERMESWYK